MAAAVGATRDGRGHRLLAGCAGSQLVHGYSGHGRGPPPGNRDRTFAAASVVAILELRFPFLFLDRRIDRCRECKRTGVATAARSTRSLISDHSVRVPGTARTQKSENFIPAHAVQVKSPSSRSTTSSPLGFWVLDL